MQRNIALVASLTLLSVASISSSVAADTSRDAFTRSLLQTTDCSSTGTCASGLSCQEDKDTSLGTACTPASSSTARCTCTAGPLPENAVCSTASSNNALCDSSTTCDVAASAASEGLAGICLPSNIKDYSEDCSKTGVACRRGTSCIVATTDTYATTSNYTSCTQTDSGTDLCFCAKGPIPLNGYCFIYGAACESGTFCYTGRADATGGYCRLVGGASSVAPAAAPEASAAAPAPSVPSCTTAGNSCLTGQSCVNSITGAICGTSSITDCQCSSTALLQGTQCDLYGAPCATDLTCKTPRADTTVGKCSAYDLLSSDADCSAVGTTCMPGTTCIINTGNLALCEQGTDSCVCSELANTVPIGTECDPWGAACTTGKARCLTNSTTGAASCGSAQTALATTQTPAPACSPPGTPGPSAQFCATGYSCVDSAGALCSITSGCTCSALSATNGVCQVNGAPCASGLTCRPPRADTTVGFCLPQLWGNTINKAGAGSSSGGVTGTWNGGVQGPDGAGVGVVASSSSSSDSTPYGSYIAPPPPPPSTTATLRPVNKAASKIYVVAATCTLADVALTDFQQAAYQSKFVATLVSNIETLTSSPVNVTIANYTSGSVVTTLNTYFLDDNQASANTYATVMKSGTVSSIFGTGYGSVTVDPNSVKTTTTANPSKTSGVAAVNLSLAAVTLFGAAVASIFLG